MQKIIEKLKEEMSTLEGSTEGASAIIGEMEAQSSGTTLTRLFRKGGEFSITRAILILSWIAGLGMYVFGSLFSGTDLAMIGATVPKFDSAAFLAVTGAASSLYFANHNVKVGKSGDG